MSQYRTSVKTSWIFLTVKKQINIDAILYFDRITLITQGSEICYQMEMGTLWGKQWELFAFLVNCLDCRSPVLIRCKKWQHLFFLLPQIVNMYISNLESNKPHPTRHPVWNQLLLYSTHGTSYLGFGVISLDSWCSRNNDTPLGKRSRSNAHNAHIAH